MVVYLTLKQPPVLPIEADTITPNEFAGKTSYEIGELAVQQGNESKILSDFFEIKGESSSNPNETEIEITGDLRKIKMIGKRTSGGKIGITGNVGMYLGAEMIAGRIHVNGSVGAWAAAEMKGGNIQIEGDAGDCLCAGYRGSPDGMEGGRVYVAGDVGREMALHMRRGFIAVKGNVSELCASRMRGGSIIIQGDLGSRAGVEATRGMMFVLGKIESVLPTYRYTGTSEREITGYYLRYLQSRRSDFLPEFIQPSEKWMKFIGDFAEGNPRFEIFSKASSNFHLLD